jgi:SAM-dependent methyltransferase
MERELGIHGDGDEPSGWVLRFASLVSPGGTVLDIASGSGRHTRLFLRLGHRVVAVDKDVSGIADLAANHDLEILEVDLEDGRPFPLSGRLFEGVIVARYLHRPLLPHLVEAVAAGGVFIYETFAKGHDRFGSPTNPDYLLEPGELLEAVRGQLRVLAYEDLVLEEPRPAAIQRICAVRPMGA